MKKIVLMILLPVLLVSQVLAWAPSQLGSGTPEKFEMTFLKLTMIKQDGTEVVVNNTPAKVDLATANPGQSLGEVLGGSVPSGVYTQLNSTVSMTITMKGAVKIGPIIYYTTATTVTVPPSDPEKSSGDGCVAGIYDNDMPGGVAYATVEDWLAAGAPAQAGEDAYGEVSMRPPETDETHTASIDGEETVADGDVIDETMEADVAGVLQVWDFTSDPLIGEVILFPGAPYIGIQ